MIGGGFNSAAVAEDDLRLGFKPGLCVGVLPVRDCLVVIWVVSPVEISASIREESVLLREKEMDMMSFVKKG